MALYVHLSGASDPAQAIVESVKLPIIHQSTTVDTVRQQIVDYLTIERNDGNKSYAIEAISSVDGVLEGSIQVVNGDDLFVSVSVTVDAQKHVKPLVVKQTDTSSFDILKFKTLTKYTYYESGKDYLKVDLSELAGVTTSDKINVDF